MGLLYHAIRVPVAAQLLPGAPAVAPCPMPWKVVPLRVVLCAVRVGPDKWQTSTWLRSATSRCTSCARKTPSARRSPCSPSFHRRADVLASVGSPMGGVGGGVGRNQARGSWGVPPASKGGNEPRAALYGQWRQINVSFRSTHHDDLHTLIHSFPNKQRKMEGVAPVRNEAGNATSALRCVCSTA